MHVVRDDAPVSDFLFGDYTFVNLFWQSITECRCRRVSLATSGSGLKTPRSTIAAAIADVGLHDENAPGLRTSPVKRGYWVVRRLLAKSFRRAAERASFAGR